MAYDPNNIFARILREEIPCKKVYEDQFALAFHDIRPQAPVHVLVIPKKHVRSLAETKDGDTEMLGHLLKVVREALIISESSYSLKKVEHFYMSKRGGEVATAADSIVAYEQWRVNGDQIGRGRGAEIGQ